MKICIIGNSHTVCIAEAWKTLKAQYPDVSLTFHRRSGQFYDHFQADPSQKILTITDSWSKQCIQQSSGGDGNIDFSQFDICLLVGAYSFRWPSEIAQLGGQAKVGYSAQAIMAAAKDMFESAHASLIFPIIREVSDIPIYQFHDPFLAHPKGWNGPQLKHAIKHYDYQRGVDLMNEFIYKPLGSELIPQPAETFAADNWTKFDLAVGFRKPFPAEVKAGFTADMKEDRGHMIPEFGKMRLEAFFDRLGIKAAT